MKIIVLLMILFIPLSKINAQQGEVPQLSQPKIVVLPKSLEGIDALTMMKKDPQINSAVAAIKQVLVERKLDVADLEQSVTNFDALRSQMAGLNADPNAMIASAADADVYLEFQMEIQKGRSNKATINFNVKEVGTSKVLGASTGVSDESPSSDISALCRMAVNNAMDRIMEQVRGYWSELPKYGKPIMLTVSFVNKKVNDELPDGKYIDETVEDWIKDNSKSYRVGSSTDKSLSYSPIYVDYIKYDSPTKFGRELRKFFDKTLNIKIDLQTTGKSIRIQEK